MQTESRNDNVLILYLTINFIRFGKNNLNANCNYPINTMPIKLYIIYEYY